MPSSEPKTPVVFFVFRRPEPTRLVFDQIRAYAPEKLFIVADGPNPSRHHEAELVQRTRAIVANVDWPCDVVRIYASQNLGLRSRILTGLDEVFSRTDEAIILEDDCRPSISFFEFCSSMLREYKDEDRVGMISGANFAPYVSRGSDFHFSTSPYIWGWATWARCWREFRSSPQVEEWTDREQAEVRATFPSRSQAKEFIGMMRAAKSLNTWDISLAVWFRQNRKLAIVPRENLIKNIGFGAGATHTAFEAFDVDLDAKEMPGPYSHPLQIEPDLARERRMWRTKQLRWISFPLSHPVDFMQRVLRFFSSRSEAKKTQ